MVVLKTHYIGQPGATVQLCDGAGRPFARLSIRKLIEHREEIDKILLQHRAARSTFR